MEKISEKISSTKVPKKEKKSSILKIFEKLDEVFKSFDEDDDASAQYYVRDLPPVPTDENVKHYLLKNALLLIDNGQFKMAKHILADILKKDSYNVEAIRWMGWCFKREGQTQNAIKCYEQLIQLRKNEQDYFELGEIYYELKNDEKARDLWLAALQLCTEQSPRLFDLHKDLGNAYLRLADFESAEENYNKALTLRPNSDALQVNLGSMFFYKKDLKNSMLCFKNAIDINPYNDRAWCGVGLVARQMNDKPWALSVVLKSLDINPENLIALQVLVQWAFEDKNYTHAIDRVQRYSFENQNNVHMIYTLAGLFFQCGDYLSAEMELERMLSLEPENQDGLMLLEMVKHNKELNSEQSGT